MTVPATPTKPLYRRILVAVDGSATSATGLREAIRLARLCGATLHLVHIVDVLEHASGFEPHAVFAVEVVRRMRARGQSVLAAAEAIAVAEGVTVSSSLLEAGRAAKPELILREARSANADLIVLGTHGRRGLERALAGSHAEQTLRQAHLPVLLVRHPEAADARTTA